VLARPHLFLVRLPAHGKHRQRSNSACRCRCAAGRYDRLQRKLSHLGERRHLYKEACNRQGLFLQGVPSGAVRLLPPPRVAQSALQLVSRDMSAMVRQAPADSRGWHVRWSGPPVFRAACRLPNAERCPPTAAAAADLRPRVEAVTDRLCRRLLGGRCHRQALPWRAATKASTNAGRLCVTLRGPQHAPAEHRKLQDLLDLARPHLRRHLRILNNALLLMHL